MQDREVQPGLPHEVTNRAWVESSEVVPAESRDVGAEAEPEQPGEDRGHAGTLAPAG